MLKTHNNIAWLKKISENNLNIGNLNYMNCEFFTHVNNNFLQYKYFEFSYKTTN